MAWVVTTAVVLEGRTKRSQLHTGT
jgi:hypothetical protein